MTGPLAGLRVVELAGLGPAPFAAMMLAELGADVVRVDRPGGSSILPGREDVDLFNRGKRSVLLDLKQPGGLDAALALIERSAVVIEGYRPGVAERLGLGPEVCQARNPRLIYGRMTGWGQSGPMADRAGHDLDYIALAGALDSIGTPEGPPVIPLNLVGDFGGGSLYLVIGVLSALVETARSGVGQIIDAAIVDGVSHLMTAVHMLTAAGVWHEGRGTNMLDGGAPYYSVYRTADDRYMAMGAVERRFYAQALELLAVDVDPAHQDDETTWAATRERLAQAFGARTRAEWTATFAGSDACVVPVLSLEEAPGDPHMASRGNVVHRNGLLQAAPAPRFSRSTTTFTTPPPLPGADTRAVLTDWGVEADPELFADGAVIQRA